MKRYFWFVVTFSISVTIIAEEQNPYSAISNLKRVLEIPKQFETIHDFNPVTYLEMFTDHDVSRFTDASGSLSLENKEKLKAIFFAANKSTIKKYKQSYLINSKSPLVRLLNKEYPGILKVEMEPDGSIYMSDIIDILRASEQRLNQKYPSKIDHKGKKKNSNK